MKTVGEYIASGILELYVLGLTDSSTNKHIYELTQTHSALLQEIERIELSIIEGTHTAKSPSANAKAFVLATIDYTERLKNGELPQEPPLLNSNSKASDYEQWLSRADMTLPENAGDTYGKIIGYNSNAITLISWLKIGSPHEVHTNELERFLIIEGTCDIAFDTGVVHHLKAGDFLEIPLHIGHTLTVTSNTPCKVVLQRVAA